MSWRLAPTVAGLAGVVAAVLHPLLYGRVLFERDILTYWYEEVEVFAQTVAAGAWPVWDPWISFGQPFLANPETQVLYPFTWLNLVTPPAFVYTAFVLAHLVFSGLGLFLLARRFEVSDGRRVRGRGGVDDVGALALVRERLASLCRRGVDSPGRSSPPTPASPRARDAARWPSGPGSSACRRWPGRRTWR